MLQELLPCAHYRSLKKPGSGRMGPSGMTEDGVERTRLLILAIGEKKGRTTANDLGKTWLKYMDPDNFGGQMEPCDEAIYMTRSMVEDFGLVGSWTEPFRVFCHRPFV